MHLNHITSIIISQCPYVKQLAATRSYSELALQFVLKAIIALLPRLGQGAEGETTITSSRIPSRLLRQQTRLKYPTSITACT